MQDIYIAFERQVLIFTHRLSVLGIVRDYAKKFASEHGKAVYVSYTKTLCRAFRILRERMIECELITDVVQRYRRAINTMGKIGNLSKPMPPVLQEAQ